MRQQVAFALSVAFAVFSLSAVAGVAPNHGASQMSQSGAKIAPAKQAEDKKEQQEESKEPAK